MEASWARVDSGNSMTNQRKTINMVAMVVFLRVLFIVEYNSITLN
jgi:hypothetical protein